MYVVSIGNGPWLVRGLERALGVDLMHRTTRRLTLTNAGAAYAERCTEIVRLAEEANRAVSDVDEVLRGALRVTADPVFGDAFVTGLVTDYAMRWPETRLPPPPLLDVAGLA